MCFRRQMLPHLICALICAVLCKQAQAEVTEFRDFLREFPAAYALQGPSSGKAGDEQRFARVFEELVKRLKLPTELSREAVPKLAEQLSQDEKAPLMDRARADFVRAQYQQA